MNNLHTDFLETAVSRNGADVELQEWIDSLEYVIRHGDAERVTEILRSLSAHAHKAGVKIPFTANTPYINTIRPDDQPPYPGSREIERRIKSIIRWNAMAMVVRANQELDGIGGHISTFASSATLYEVAFNHFLRASINGGPGDQVYIQGHASPGIYARAFLEGRLSEQQLLNFRRELREGGGLSSYPHPWLMPDFWEFPTVSMGLSPIMAIYHARFIKYLEGRGLKEASGQKVWAFLGDGETDEPESLGAITLAAREGLDNLIYVINCNLQRLDGPVRGNGQIIQELEAAFRGAGWNVIKVIWGDDWDPLIEHDTHGKLVKRMGEIVDGWYQKYTVSDGAFIREHFCNGDDDLKELFSHLGDEQVRKLRRGGHDPEKVFAAYTAATTHKDQPTVILAHTVKGYGMGEAGEGKNITHQQKKLNEQELAQFRSRFGIPISDDEVADAPFYKPADDSPEMQYLRERREALGGQMPKRIMRAEPLTTPDEELFEEFYEGTGDRAASTTMVFVRLLSKLLRDEGIGKLVVPIVPDEARTFGMESLFRQVGIYASKGQLYEPVDADSLLYYKEATDGQILEEGITEAGSMSSFIAAGISPAQHGINTIPFFIYYSMFGFQRIGDLIWAAGDMRARGFMVGGTSGRTTLNGEGLQHQDGHSHVAASTVPNCISYDPAFAFELAVIVREGIRRMYEKQEDVFYYITVHNENYTQPPLPADQQAEDVKQGILRGLYRFRAAESGKDKLRVHLFGSGAIFNEAAKAQEILAKYDIRADLWSVTSHNELHKDATDCDRHNRLNPNAEPRQSWLEQCFDGEDDAIFVAASDYQKSQVDKLARWLPGPLVALGTDGFGRSESRDALRDHFEVDAKHIAWGALAGLARAGRIKPDKLDDIRSKLGIDPDRVNPQFA